MSVKLCVHIHVLLPLDHMFCVKYKLSCFCCARVYVCWVTFTYMYVHILRWRVLAHQGAFFMHDWTSAYTYVVIHLENFRLYVWCLSPHTEYPIYVYCSNFHHHVHAHSVIFQHMTKLVCSHLPNTKSFAFI